MMLGAMWAGDWEEQIAQIAADVGDAICYLFFFEQHSDHQLLACAAKQSRRPAKQGKGELVP